MITKQQIELLTVRESLQHTYETKQEIQRIRNYCNTLEGEFQTRVKSGKVTVTRISHISKESLTSDLRQMEVGEVLYPSRSNKIALVQGTAAALEGEYEISTVVKVRRVK